MPFVTLIIPIYNAERYLRRCLDSVMEQTYADMEVLLMNDGSTDGSLAICREYEEKDQIQEIRQCCWPEELICSFWTAMTG